MTDDRALEEILRHGQLELEGRLPGASNATLRGVATLDGMDVVCVYKPRRGERPLWDFPSGSLGNREVATYLVARDLGWPLVPVTVWRDDGPYGEGMCQAWVDAVDSPVDVIPVQELRDGWRVIAEGDGLDGRAVVLAHEDSRDLRALALLDAVVNNADRKGGHVLRDPHGAVAGIDHGLTFHEEDKVRTVLWGWAGEPIGDDEMESLSAAGTRWREDSGLAFLDEHLAMREIRQLRRRLQRLLEARTFPEPDGVWPALPWPAM